MTATASPQHAAALRERLEQIHGSIGTLETEQAEANQAVRVALEGDSTPAIVKAQSRASAVRDALATRRRTEETVAAELALAEAEEVREAGIRQMLEEAKAADKALTRFDTLLPEEAGRLTASIRKLLAGRATLGEHRRRFFGAAEQLAPGLYSADSRTRAAGQDLRAELEGRGAALRAIAAVEFQGYSNPFEHAGDSYQPPTLDAFGQALMELVDRFHIAELRRAETERIHRERAAEAAERTTAV